MTLLHVIDLNYIINIAFMNTVIILYSYNSMAEAAWRNSDGYLGQST